MGTSPEDSKSNKSGSGSRRAVKVVSFEEARKSSRARLGQRKEFNIARGALKEGALYDPNEVIADPDPVKQVKRPKLVKRSAKDDPKRVARPNISKKTQPLTQSDQKALMQAQSQSRPTIAKDVKASKASAPIEQAERPSAAETKSRVAIRVDSMREAREERRRAKTKAKADKKFDAQYGDAAVTRPIIGGRSKASNASAASEGGPRAAVYAGKMGALHKKSTKLQSKAKERASSMKGELTLPSIELPFTSKRAWNAIFAVALCFMCAFMLYGPAQQYYVQMRETDRLQAEYLAVSQRSDNLQASIDSLQTDAGIEDKAHADLGYIKSGEKTGTVKGIDFDDDKEFSSNVVPNSVPAPDTWYSPFFDVFFNYVK